jgi:hypothetical protein
MKFPNLVWAIDDRRLACYELASAIKVERTRLSRCMNGQFTFAPHEKARIAEVLGYAESWLFAEPRPPRISPTDQRVGLEA